MRMVAVLQSRKQIAKYLGRTERTVQRWELQFGLPIHRPSGKSRSAVMALTQEIEEWTRDKPSLVQIRTNARLSLARFKPSRDLTTAVPQKELLRQTRLERLRQAALLHEQKQLRRDGRNLRQQQHELLKLLRQNLETRR